MSSDDELLARDLEGLLDDAQADELGARLEREPELRRARDELERILEEPLGLEPVEVPAALGDWVGARLEDRAEACDSLEAALAGGLEPVEPPASLVEFVRERARAAGEPEAKDPLAEPLELEPIPVPAELEVWTRAQARGAREEQASAPAPEARGRVIPFPAVGWLAAAALLLVAFGLGLAGAAARNAAERATLAEKSAKDDLQAARAEAARLREEGGQAEGAQKELRGRLEAAERKLGQRERELGILEAQRVAEARALKAEFAQRRQELESSLAEARGQAQEQAERLSAQARTLAEREGELSEARAALAVRQTETPERVRELEARLARAERQAQAAEERAATLARARQPAGAEEGVRVRAAVGVRRWDPERGWSRLRRGATLRPGEIVAGEGLQGRVQLAGLGQRLSPQLYVFAEGQLRPLPASTAPRAAPDLPRGAYRRDEPTPQRGGGFLGVIAPR